MADTVTIALEGTVTLEDFAAAVREFSGLIAALADDVTPDSDVQWVVDQLHAGSATATIRGVGKPDAIESIVTAYENVGVSLEHAQIPSYSPRVRKHATALTKLIDGRIDSIRLETEARDATIRAIPQQVATAGVATITEVATSDAIGAVEGVVETLSHRGGLRFTLYDILREKAVSCYLSEGYENIMRDIWGKRAIVRGRVHRDPVTGRALSIRQVTHVDPVEHGQPADWRLAIGAVPYKGSIPPEAAIRLLRDG